MDTKNFKSLESLEAASNVEDALRTLDRQQKLQLLVIMEDGHDYPLAAAEDKHIAEILIKHGSITIQFNLDS